MVCSCGCFGLRVLGCSAGAWSDWSVCVLGVMLKNSQVAQRYHVLLQAECSLLDASASAANVLKQKQPRNLDCCHLSRLSTFSSNAGGAAV